MRTTLSSTCKTIVISRNRLFQEGLACLLKGTKYEACALARDIDELHEWPAENISGAVVLLDDRRDTAETIPTISRLREERPGSAVIVLSDKLQPRFMAACLSAGASGYLLTDICFEALLQTLELVTLGEKVFPTQLATVFVNENASSEDQVGAGKLSGREQQILQFLIRGDSNKVIARRLDIADATVKVHMKGLLKKIRVENRTQAAVWALNHGFEATADVSLCAGAAPAKQKDPARQAAVEHYG